MENRAAVFTSQPQDVEVYSAGEWLPGALLGWRHDATGGCQVWVRLTVGEAEESAWTDLECLRLPERHLSVATDPAVGAGSGEDPAATRSLRLAEVSTTGRVRRGRPAAPGAVRSSGSLGRAVPAGRDEAASRASHPAGRRRADSRVVGETAEFPAVASVGRHRAPAPPAAPGRHRAADTGVWPIVVAAEGAVRTPRTRAAEAWGTRPDDTSPGRAPEPDLLTRPMRLDAAEMGGSIPEPRRARRDGALRA